LILGSGDGVEGSPIFYRGGKESRGEGALMEKTTGQYIRKSGKCRGCGPCDLMSRKITQARNAAKYNPTKVGEENEKEGGGHGFVVNV